MLFEWKCMSAYECKYIIYVCVHMDENADMSAYACCLGEYTCVFIYRYDALLVPPREAVPLLPVPSSGLVLGVLGPPLLPTLTTQTLLTVCSRGHQTPEGTPGTTHSGR